MLCLITAFRSGWAPSNDVIRTLCRNVHVYAERRLTTATVSDSSCRGVRSQGEHAIRDKYSCPSPCSRSNSAVTSHHT